MSGAELPNGAGTKSPDDGPEAADAPEAAEVAGEASPGTAFAASQRSSR